MTIRKTDYENYDYREFWMGDKRAYEDTSERIALRKLLDPIGEDSKVFLDIGCGYGRLFNEYKNFKNIILVDYSLKNLENAKQRIENFLGLNTEKLSSVYFLAGDALNLPLKSDCADVILTVRVVHHLDNLEKYFDEIKRILKDRGIFILEFANKRNLKNLLRFFIGHMDTSPFNLLLSRVGETILNYHPRYIGNFLSERGFTIEKKISVSNFRLEFLKKHIGMQVLLLLERWFQRVFSWTLLGPSIFLRCTLRKSNKNGKNNKESNNNEKKENKRREKFRKEVDSGVSNNVSSTVVNSNIRIEDILVCPRCRKNGLSFGKSEIICNSCKSVFPIRDGIYIFK